MDKDELEKIKRLAEAYGKQKTLKDRIKFVSDNPIELEGINEKKFCIKRLFLIKDNKFINLYLSNYFKDSNMI